MEKIKMSNFNPSKGGHAPGYLREAFQDAVAWNDELAEVGVIDDIGIDEEESSLEWLAGQLGATRLLQKSETTLCRSQNVEYI